MHMKKMFLIFLISGSICEAKMTKCQTSVVEHLECVSQVLESDSDLNKKNLNCDLELESKIKKYNCSKI